MEFTIKQVADLLGGELSGDGTAKVKKLAKIQDAEPGSIAFLSNPKYENFIYTTRGSAVIVNKEFIAKGPISASLIVVEDAYSSFTQLLEQYFNLKNFSKIGVENPSFIGDNSTTGDKIYRGAFSYIGNNCKIGDNVKIYPQVYIGDNVKIGDNTILYSGVKVYADCVIGSHCTMHSGVVIGSDGFGFAPQKDGSYKTIPQVGNVIIEDHVDIGANTVIDCATMDSTIIRQGVKLDNLIQIAHNVELGKNTVIAAQTGVSGSTKIGENCIIAGQVGIVGHLEIANKTTVGAQAGVGKNITEEGVVLLGSPGFERKQYLKSYAVFKNLPELRERLKELEENYTNFTISKEDK